MEIIGKFFHKVGFVVPTENLKCLDHELHFEFISEGEFKTTFV